MAKPKGGLTAWFGKGPKGDWVDIGAPKKGGKFQACGRKSAKGSKRKYPKCVPRSKAKSMSASQIKSAVSIYMPFIALQNFESFFVDATANNSPYYDITVKYLFNSIENNVNIKLQVSR